MEEEKLNNYLYILYLLETVYKDDEELENESIVNFQISLEGNTNSNYKTKEDLTKLIKLKLNKIFNKLELNEEATINFKIGDVIKTSESSSIINLKFVIINNQGVKRISIFEKNIKIKSI